ncbi:MAG: AI-2E family transporter, partial [Gemmatimonadota bacterium]
RVGGGGALFGSPIRHYSLAMQLLNTKHQRAAILILVLGIALIVALSPFATGLIGIPVLYIIFFPVYAALVPRIKPTAAAAVSVALALLLVLALALTLTVVLVNQAPAIASGLLQSPLRERLNDLEIGGFRLGPRLATFGERLVTWIGNGAIGLIGTATRISLNLTISLFGLFYLFLSAGQIWHAVEPYIPFSTTNSEQLKSRFKLVTISTLVGTGLTAVIQGILVGLAFWVTGLSNPLFWGVTTVIVAVLPIVGSGMIWLPGVLVLYLDHRYGAGTLMAIWGVVVVANVDNVIRPLVFRRYAQIHPLVTLIGAFAGIRYFGLLGLMVGPLALSYFFELIRMYKEEYIETTILIEQ